MPTILTRDNRHVSYDPLALSEARRWAGDAALIAELTDALARGSVTLEEPGLSIPFSSDTPMHNVVAAALALGFDLQSDEDTDAPWAPMDGGVKVAYDGKAHLHDLVAASMAMGTEPAPVASPQREVYAEPSHLSEDVYVDERLDETTSVVPFNTLDEPHVPVTRDVGDGWPRFDDDSWIVN